MEYSQEAVVQQMNSARDGSIWGVLDITLVVAAKDRVVATMPIGPQHRQQLGYLHGGVSVVLAESLASLGGALNVDSNKQMVFGLEINANHLRPKREGTLTGVAVPLHRGRNTHVWEVKITDEQDRLVCISRCTIAVVDLPPDVNNPLATSTASLD